MQSLFGMLSSRTQSVVDKRRAMDVRLKAVTLRRASGTVLTACQQTQWSRVSLLGGVVWKVILRKRYMRRMTGEKLLERWWALRANPFISKRARVRTFGSRTGLLVVVIYLKRWRGRGAYDTDVGSKFLSRAIPVGLP